MNFYSRYYRTLWRNRIETARGMKVHCARNVEIEVPIGTTFRRAGDNPAIGIVEGFQFIAGVFIKEHIERIAPRARLDLFTDQSAYGPRVKSQWHMIINELKKDPSLRRAVLILPKAEEALEDRPCTSTMQFSIIDKRLDVSVTMRSSDAIWGLPYDFIQFSLVSMMLAKCLEVDTGNLRVFIGNAHIYESTHNPETTWKEAKFDLDNIKPNVITPHGFGDAVLDILNDPDLTARGLMNTVNMTEVK